LKKAKTIEQCIYNSQKKIQYVYGSKKPENPKVTKKPSCLEKSSYTPLCLDLNIYERTVTQSTFIII